MTEANWTLLITTIKWLGAGILVLLGAIKALREYLSYQNDKLQKIIDRDVAIAKEKSVGEQAIKLIEADMAMIEKEIEEIKLFKDKSATDYTVLHTLIDKLREDYRFILDRMFPSFKPRE